MNGKNTSVNAELQSNTNTHTHSSAQLPFARYSASACDMLPFYPLHWREETEITLIQEGACVLRVNGERLIAQKGDVLILRPFAIRSVNRLENCDVRLNTAVCNVRALCRNDASGRLKSFLPLLNGKNSAPYVISKTDNCYNDVINYVHSLTLSEHTCNTQADVVYNLCVLFECIFAVGRKNNDGSKKDERTAYTVKLALEYIRNKYADAVTIEQIAEHCGYSEFYTMKLFKQFTGYSCVDYVNNYRLYVIGRALRETTEDVAAIAQNTGYNNVSYFNRQFKRLYGQTPKEFRKQWTAPPK